MRRAYPSRSPQHSANTVCFARALEPQQLGCVAANALSSITTPTGTIFLLHNAACNRTTAMHLGSIQRLIPSEFKPSALFVSHLQPHPTEPPPDSGRQRTVPLNGAASLSTGDCQKQHHQKPPEA
jgi:hypothetical protein